MPVVYVAVSSEDRIKGYVPSASTGALVLPFQQVDCPSPFQLCVSPDGKFLFAVSTGPENEHVSYGAPPLPSAPSPAPCCPL